MRDNLYPAAIIAIICQSTLAATAVFGLSYVNFMTFALMNQFAILIFCLLAVTFVLRGNFFSVYIESITRVLSSLKHTFLLLLSATAVIGSDLSLYYALTISPKIEAYVIQAIWPILAICFGMIFIKSRWGKIRKGTIFLVFLSFFGAVLIVSQGNISIDSNVSYGYLAAFFCACCGATFTIINPIILDKFTGNNKYLSSLQLHFTLRILITPILAIYIIENEQLDFNAQALPFAIWSGVVVWGIGSSLWTYVYSAAKDLSVSSLPYVITVGNVFFLFLIHDEPLSYLTLISASLILISNILIHSNYRYFHTNIVFLSSIFIIGLLVIYVPSSNFKSPIEIGYIGTVFAIVASFVLNRLVARNQKTAELFSSLSSDVAIISEATKNHKSATYIKGNFDSILCSIIDYDYADNERKRDDVLRGIFACETNIRRQLLAKHSNTNNNEVFDHFNDFSSKLSQWASTRSEYLSKSEIIVLGVLGLVASLSSILQREGDIWSDCIAILISSAFVFLLSTIRDYSYNRNSQTFISIMSQQRLLHRCGLDSYMPKAYMKSGQFPAPNLTHTFRIDNTTGETMIVRKVPIGIRILPYGIILFAAFVFVLALLDKHNIL